MRRLSQLIVSIGKLIIPKCQNGCSVSLWQAEFHMIARIMIAAAYIYCLSIIGHMAVICMAISSPGKSTVFIHICSAHISIIEIK